MRYFGVIDKETGLLLRFGKARAEQTVAAGEELIEFDMRPRPGAIYRWIDDALVEE